MYYLDYRGDAFLAQLQLIADEQSLNEEQKKTLEQLEESAADREELQQYVLKGNEGTVAFLSEMDRVAAELGISLATNKLDVSEDGATFDTLNVTFTAEGNVEAVDTFVLLLETMPYVSHVTSLDLSYQTDSDTGEQSARATVGLAISIISS